MLNQDNKKVDRVSEGLDILMYIDKRRRWIVKIRKGSVFGSDRGYIKHDAIIDIPFGASIPLSTGAKAWILKPLLIDYLEKGFKRVTQVLYPKDIGLIIVLLGIAPGHRVLEAGIGSGFLTSVLANIVKPNGRVYAYEIREEFANIAKMNLERIGLLDYVTIKIKDIKEGIDERDLDAAILDMPNPWEVVDVLYQALKPSAPIIFFLPTINQVEKLFNALQQHGGFIDIRCYELLLREYRLTSGALRPETRMIGHTGYILFTRKVIKKISHT